MALQTGHGAKSENAGQFYIAGGQVLMSMRSSSEMLRSAVAAAKETLQSLLDLDAQVESRARFFRARRQDLLLRRNPAL